MTRRTVWMLAINSIGLSLVGVVLLVKKDEPLGWFILLCGLASAGLWRLAYWDDQP